MALIDFRNTILSMYNKNPSNSITYIYFAAWNHQLKKNSANNIKKIAHSGAKKQTKILKHFKTVYFYIFTKQFKDFILN